MVGEILMVFVWVWFFILVLMFLGFLVDLVVFVCFFILGVIDDFGGGLLDIFIGFLYGVNFRFGCELGIIGR